MRQEKKRVRKIVTESPITSAQIRIEHKFLELTLL